MKELLTPYPFLSTEDRSLVEFETEKHMHEILQLPIFDGHDRNLLLSRLNTFYAFANMEFNEEEELRTNGFKGANLYYHGRPHGVMQTTYDGISIAKAILQRDDAFSHHLTLEGVLSIVLGSMFHETGYVNAGPVENYAARSPIHVEESIKTYSSYIDLLGLPAGIDIDKVKKMGGIGIYSTHFPFTDTHLEEIRKMTQELTTDDRKEAQIVRLSIQLADLGGQCARPDYYPNLVVNLRQELNEGKPDLGNETIGKDCEMAENRAVFLETNLKAGSDRKTVGNTLNAFFDKEVGKPFKEAMLGLTQP